MSLRAIELLNEQQRKVKERSAPWTVAEQLKDICRREPESAELLAKDLENPSMGIVQAEKKIAAFASAHRVDNRACVSGLEAEEILRKFYGLGTPSASSSGGDSKILDSTPSTFSGGDAPKILDLADFL